MFFLRKQNSIEFWISLIGGLASLYGIFITIVELHKTKKIADMTKEAVDNNNKYIRTVMDATKFADTIRLTEEIEAFLTSERYGEASIKMQECRKILISLKTSDAIKELNKYNRSLQKLGLKIKTLSKNRNNPENIDTDKILSDFFDLKGILTEMSTVLEQNIGKDE